MDKECELAAAVRVLTILALVIKSGKRQKRRVAYTIKADVAVYVREKVDGYAGANAFLVVHRHDLHFDAGAEIDFHHPLDCSGYKLFFVIDRNQDGESGGHGRLIQRDAADDRSRVNGQVYSVPEFSR